MFILFVVDVKKKKKCYIFILFFYINMVSLKHIGEKSNLICQNTLPKMSDLDYVTNLYYNL